MFNSQFKSMPKYSKKGEDNARAGQDSQIKKIKVT